MTDQNHPITPSKALEHKWASMFEQHSHMEVFTEVARWGADQELEACLKWMGSFCATWTCGRRPEDVLRTARRPKPPSLKEEALQGFKTVSQFVLDEWHGCADYEKFKKITDTVQRALEALPNG